MPKLPETKPISISLFTCQGCGSTKHHQQQVSNQVLRVCDDCHRTVAIIKTYKVTDTTSE